MVSATPFRHFGFGRFGLIAALLMGFLDLTGQAKAQSATDGDTADAVEEDQAADEAVSGIDRGKMRLRLLITLVENELQEATTSQARLIAEASRLDQELRGLQAGSSAGTEAEKRQIEVIERRLGEIDQEMAEVNTRLPAIDAELTELQARLDEANGVERTPATAAAGGAAAGTEGAGSDVAASDAAGGPAPIDGASQWLDSKRRVQEALVYLGGYNALIDGDFGPRTQEAVRVYQTRQNLDVTGRLDGQQEAALLEEADRLRARYGMTVLLDQEMGYRFSYPSGLLRESDEVPAEGRRFVTEDGQGELLITRDDDGRKDAAALSTIYEQLLGEYEVQYRRKRGDWFVVAGLVEDGRIVYETGRLSRDGVVRARLSYPADWRDLWSPFAVIMFNSFEALPSAES